MRITREPYNNPFHWPRRIRPFRSPSTIRGVASTCCDVFQQHRRLRPISPTYERIQPRNVLFSPEGLCKLVLDSLDSAARHRSRRQGAVERGKNLLPSDRGRGAFPN